MARRNLEQADICPWVSLGRVGQAAAPPELAESNDVVQKNCSAKFLLTLGTSMFATLRPQFRRKMIFYESKRDCPARFEKKVISAFLIRGQQQTCTPERKRVLMVLPQTLQPHSCISGCGL